MFIETREHRGMQMISASACLTVTPPLCSYRPTGPIRQQLLRSGTLPRAFETNSSRFGCSATRFCGHRYTVPVLP